MYTAHIYIYIDVLHCIIINTNLGRRRHVTFTNYRYQYWPVAALSTLGAVSVPPAWFGTAAQSAANTSRTYGWVWKQRAAKTSRDQLRAYLLQPWRIMTQQHQWGWNGHVA